MKGGGCNRADPTFELCFGDVNFVDREYTGWLVAVHVFLRKRKETHFHNFHPSHTMHKDTFWLQGNKAMFGCP